MGLYSLTEFERAANFLRGKIVRTPLVRAPNREIFLKAECLQLAGSFKIRGATYCMSLHTEEERARGVLAYSTGNHAKAVALAAKLLGIKATIVMSEAAPLFKIEAVKASGATLIMAESSDVMREVAEEIAKKEGSYLISPYDHPEVITGQGTIGLEILEESEPACVYVPVGGGGLIAGIAAAIKQKRPHIKIIGVEPELEEDAGRSLRSGTIQHHKGPSATIADAVKITCLGEHTFPLIQKYVDEMVTVSEKEIRDATLAILQETHLLVEPSGALGYAAALRDETALPKVVVASGGNTTLAALHAIAINPRLI